MQPQRLTDVIFLLFDNELEDDLRSSLQTHLSSCPHCAQEIEHTRRLLMIVRTRCQRRPAPSSLRSRILDSMPHRDRDSRQPRS